MLFAITYDHHLIVHNGVYIVFQLSPESLWISTPRTLVAGYLGTAFCPDGLTIDLVDALLEVSELTVCNVDGFVFVGGRRF